MQALKLSRTPLAEAVSRRHPRGAMLSGALLTLMLLGSTQAQATPVDVNIPAQSLSKALQQLGQQANLQILYSPETLAGLQSSAVSGHLEPKQALDNLLLGSGMTYQLNGNAVSLMPAAGAAAGNAMELGAVSISGKAPGSTTEGTGLYTTYSSSSSTRPEPDTPRKPRSR